MMVLRTRLAAAVLAAVLAPCSLPAQNAPQPGGDASDHGLPRPPAWKSVEVGDFYLKRKSYRAALNRYKEAAKTDPYYPQAYLGQAKVYDSLGLRQMALENYQKYLDLLPSSKQAAEARDVHKAIERLRRKLKAAHSSRHPTTESSSSSSSD